MVNKSGNIQEVTVYVDGIYEYSYTKNSGTIDTNRNYNTLHIMDPSSGSGQAGNTRVGTQRTGSDADDSTPAQKYFVEDHLGNCSVAVKTDGGRINMEEFFPFGQTSFGSYAKKRYRYNGKEKDEHTGLYEYGQRYYAPWLCRFVSVDPIAQDYPQLSSYNYAGNKPISAKDIEGLTGEQESVKNEGNSDSNGIRTLEHSNGDDSGEMVNIPAHGTGDDLSDSMVDLVGNDSDPKKSSKENEKNAPVHEVPFIDLGLNTSLNSIEKVLSDDQINLNNEHLQNDNKPFSPIDLADPDVDEKILQLFKDVELYSNRAFEGSRDESLNKLPLEMQDIFYISDKDAFKEMWSSQSILGADTWYTRNTEIEIGGEIIQFEIKLFSIKKYANLNRIEKIKHSIIYDKHKMPHGIALRNNVISQGSPFGSDQVVLRFALQKHMAKLWNSKIANE